MDIYRDLIRRQAKEIEVEHNQAMKHDVATLDHLVNGEGAALGADTKADLILGGLNRRKFLMFGSTAVLSSAVFAACKGATPAVVATPATSSTTAAVGSAKDITILRTASSIEAVAVALYDQILKGGLIKNPAIVDAAKLFQSQHVQHGELFQRSTKAAGGTPLADANPVLMQQVVQLRLATLQSEADAVSLALDFEHLAAATYQTNIGTFEHGKWNATVAGVGATEARHVALLAVLSATSATGTPDDAFQKDVDAVKPGTGV